MYTLLTREGCHLCDNAARHLQAAGIRFLAVDINGRAELRETYDFRVPVVLDAAGKVVAEGRIDAASARRLAR